MKRNCPNSNCPHYNKSVSIIKNGRYKREFGATKDFSEKAPPRRDSSDTNSSRPARSNNRPNNNRNSNNSNSNRSNNRNGKFARNGRPDDNRKGRNNNNSNRKPRKNADGTSTSSRGAKYVIDENGEKNLNC